MKLLTAFGLLLALTCLSPLTAQRYFELGAMAGDMPYNGDLSDEGAAFLNDFNAFGGLYLRYRPISRVGLRLNGIFGRIAAVKETSVRTNDSPATRADITRNFRSSIQEFSLAAEVDLFYLGDPEDRFIAPYVMVGIGRTTFNPQSELEGVYYDLQPLQTEAQEIPYALDITTYHLGGGLRAKLGERIVVGGEISGRITGTDYLDDVSNLSVNYNDVLADGGAIAARFSNPAIDPLGDDIPDSLNYRRGGDSDDFYFLINLTVGIRLGGWGGGGGSGCYSF